jgi:hypothetical protein
VSGRDRRVPYPSMHERAEFNEEASNFTRMDMNTKDALSTLANLAQVPPHAWSPCGNAHITAFKFPIFH